MKYHELSEHAQARARKRWYYARFTAKLTICHDIVDKILRNKDYRFDPYGDFVNDVSFKRLVEGCKVIPFRGVR